MTSRLSILVLALLSVAGDRQVKPASSSFNGYDLVDKTGIIRKPADYRDRYQGLGAYAVVDLKDDHQMHTVYASPGTADYYRKTGKFADGTVLVKEVSGTDHAQLTTGEAYWSKGIQVWFVVIKDEKGRFSGNKLWGDGWGWALYKSDAPDKQIATDYKRDCLGCHVPAQATDWIYVQGYPSLRSK